MVSTQPPLGGSRQAEIRLRCGRGVERARLWRRGKRNGELEQPGQGVCLRERRQVNVQICFGICIVDKGARKLAR